jgi:hypothetical protein
MSTTRQAGWQKLRRVRTFAQLFNYFVDDLDWPLDPDLLEDEDLDDLTYDWDPTELGVSPERLASLKRLRQMRPLTANQPWGIFFVEFSGPRLPVTQLRRLLQGLVTKKRASGDGGRKTWDLDDLLFIVTTDDGDSVELHLLAFFEEGGRVAIRSLPWRPVESPQRHLQRLAEELLPRLTWPDDESDASAWRAAWREAFPLRHGEVIRSAARLAERMAMSAKDLRVQIAEALAEEDGAGPFNSLLNEVREHLVADVDEAKFADMCAQTLVYGVLSARVTDPEGFGASPIFATVPLANPFLASFFDQVHDQAVALDLEGSGLEQLVADLRETNVEAILDQFGSTAKGGDPVIHFYEDFLREYDRKMRADAGGFYTPQPVVEFVVRSVDQLLRDRFALTMGIADTATWAEVADLVGFDVPPGVDREQPFLSMVDPATGTGTFLIEWLRRARASFLAARPQGDWAEHLRGHVLPSMHAFELMLGPYAIAHLKVALELHREGVPDGAGVRVLLTDTLDHEAHQLTIETMKDPVASEGEAAAELKRDERFTVVIGNPPYDREQRATGDAGRRKGGVVRYGAAGIPPLLNDVTQPMQAAGLGVHIKNLYNDYVYFWRWATWQATEAQKVATVTDKPWYPGVVAFITASSYLDGVSMGGVRALLRRAFDELWIVDLGGEGRGALTEENVFDIRTPVAIAIGVRTTTTASDECTVRYLRVSGSRAEKFDALRSLDLLAAPMVEIPGTGLDPLTPRTASDYAGWPEVTDLFPWIHSGAQFKRTWPIGEGKPLLERRWRDLVTATPRQRATLLRETGFRTVKTATNSLLDGRSPLLPIRNLDRDDAPESIDRYGYRSFDRQWVIADARLADRPRPDLWQVRSPRQVFLTTLTSTKLGRGPVLTVTPYVPDLHHFRGSYGAKDVIPLYRDAASTQPNVPAGLLDSIGSALGRFVSVEDLLAYIHALAGTPAFSERFADELAEAAGPFRFPLTTAAALFDEAVNMGRDLLWWHTWGERFAPDGVSGIPPGATGQIEPVHGYPEKFSYDTAAQRLVVGTGVFGPVSQDVWDFEVSGLRVVSSWLGYRMAKRKGKSSSPLDEIRPTRWTFTDELLRLLAILEHTVKVTPAAAALIDEIVAGPLIQAADLPEPTDAERRPPRT